MWEYGLPLGEPGQKACGGCQRNRVQHRLLVIAHLPAPKRHVILCHNNQLGQKVKGGHTGELFCLFYLPAPPTNTTSVYSISLKVGVGPAQAVVSSASNDTRQPWACASSFSWGERTDWQLKAQLWLWPWPWPRLVVAVALVGGCGCERR